jgi:hypothetical protein
MDRLGIAHGLLMNYSWIAHGLLGAMTTWYSTHKDAYLNSLPS